MSLAKKIDTTKDKVAADLVTGIEQLNEQIVRHRTEFAALTESIQKAQDEKTGAKKSYTEYLDQGDTEGMESSLVRIRSTNKEIASLTAQAMDFKKKIEPLRTSQNILVAEARRQQAQAEATVKNVKAELEQTKTIVNATEELLKSVNDLQNFFEDFAIAEKKE